MDNILDVLKEFENAGYEAYFVGGYPRDLYMGLSTIDYDITTSATPKEIKEIFNEVTSDNYGCVNFIYKNNKFQATTYRKELKYKDNRKPIEIEYINDLKIDLMRRDFTINTSCLDSNGNLLDYLNGKEDIDNKIIKVVGNTNKKLQEDALRILRAIRFATTLNFELSKELYEEFSKSGVPQAGDLMVTAVGTLGKVYIVKDGDLFYYKDGSVLCLNNRYNLNPSYLKYVIESPMFINQFVGESQGTTVATLTIVRFNEYLVPIPPLREQERIVKAIDNVASIMSR